MRGLGLAFALLAAAFVPAAAQEKSPEERLRDALRQSVEEMRAAQDQAAQLQAQLAAAQQERDAAKAAEAAAEQKLTAGAAKPEQLAAAQAQLRAAAAENAQLRAAFGKMQAAYTEVVAVARGKSAEAAASGAGLADDARALETCKAMNTRLIATAEEILHVYQTFTFRALLMRSYEPVIGFAKVKLENLVQEYDDKIQSQEYMLPSAKGAAR